MLHSFKVIALKDSKTSDKNGIKTVYAVAQTTSGDMVIERAGFVKVSKDKKEGEVIAELEAQAFTIRKSTEPVEIGGENVYFEWLVPVL